MTRPSTFLREHQTMKGHPWQSCHYYPDGCCPNRSLIDRACLIPQLLAPAELAEIRTRCAGCKVRHRNKRQHRRVARVMDVVILDENSGEELHGVTLNVSQQGALIKVADCKGFQVHQAVHLRVCDKNGSCHSCRAVIKRVDSARSAISVLVLDER